MTSGSPPDWRDLLSAVAPGLPKIRAQADLDLDRNRAFAPHAADVRELPFQAEDRRYRLVVPSPEELLGPLRAGEPYAYARLPHGFWDTLWELDVAQEGLAADARTAGMPASERRALALKVCEARYRDRDNGGNFAPGFLDELLADIATHAANPAFMRALSFVGYPTWRQQAIGRGNPRARAITQHVAERFRPDERIYDGLAWKRLLISGHLEALPALARARPVVLVASAHFAGLGERWKLAQFEHVEIPPKLSQYQRAEILGRARAAVERARARGAAAPVMLSQCGGALAFWLITRLYAEFPGVFYLDLGQALDGWFFDKAEIRVYRWMKVYTRSVIENGRLEPYYRALKGAAYDEWFRSLP